VHCLQANLPSAMFTILRTATSLQPFNFNEPEAVNKLCGASVPHQQQHRNDQEKRGREKSRIHGHLSEGTEQTSSGGQH